MVVVFNIKAEAMAGREADQLGPEERLKWTGRYCSSWGGRRWWWCPCWWDGMAESCPFIRTLIFIFEFHSLSCPCDNFVSIRHTSSKGWVSVTWTDNWIRKGLNKEEGWNYNWTVELTFRAVHISQLTRTGMGFCKRIWGNLNTLILDHGQGIN